MNSAKKTPIRKPYKAFVITTSIVLVLMVIINVVILAVPLASNTMNTLFGEERRVLVYGDPSDAQHYKTDEGINTKADALAYANSVNEKICEEGFVLLKNENQTLPLSADAKVSVYGMNSVNLVYGGSGSAAKDGSEGVDLFKSLDNAGISYNGELKKFYEGQQSAGKGRPRSPDMGDVPTGFATGELPQSAYPSGSAAASAGSYTDAALVVISRIGGEGYDLPVTSVKTDGRSDETQHYLELDDNEAALLENLCAVDSPFEKVILVINCGTSMELGFLKDDAAYHGKLSAALWVGTTGGTGMNALGKILVGEVNPSGRLVDTYAADFTAIPAYMNFATNVGEGNSYLINGTAQNAHFVDYEEGIYVGYRYFETRGAEDEVWYQQNVVYPFGYGLSYTNFDWEIEDDSQIRGKDIAGSETYSVRVKVTNTGAYAGKDVVELYGHAPYTAGGIEKSEVALVGFAKTGQLQPGQSETVELTFNPYNLASYDYNGKVLENGGYVLESGEYTLYVSRNAHDRQMPIPFSVAANIVYKKAAVEGYEVENRFADVSNHIETYLSRSDWEGTFPAAPTEDDKTVDNGFMEQLTLEAYIGSGSKLDADKPWYAARKPRQKRKALSFDDTEYKLYELIGKNYDDPLWDKLLNQLTYEEMRYLIGTGNFNTAAMQNIDKPKTTDPDGPAGFTNFMTVIGGTATVYDTCFYASECVIAATWNTELVEKMGVAVGNEALIGNERGDGRSYSGWYGPAVNIHRTPFSGRNWEYYSEDGFLSGKMAASVITGAKSKGVYTYVKHFTVNDQETNRDTNGLITWVNEQALREIYLKPFELAVTEGHTSAMMSSFNRIGTVWAGGSYELLTDVLRNEWGFVGMVITDYNTNGYMYADQMIRAGGDLNLIQDKQPSASGDAVTASHQTAIRRAVKNILYTVVNSNAMNGMGEGIIYGYAMPYWKIALFAFDALVAVVLAAWGIVTFRKKK